MKKNKCKGNILTIFLIIIICLLLAIGYLCTTGILQDFIDKKSEKDYEVVSFINFKSDDIPIEPIEVAPIEKIEEIRPKKNNEIIVNEDTNYKFYYTQLDEYSKIVYTKLEENKENLKTGTYSIDFGETFNELLHEEIEQEKLNNAFQVAISAFMYDNVDIFYIDITKMNFGIMATTIGSNTTYTTYIENEENSSYLAENLETVEDVNKSIQEVENIRNVIVNSVEGMSNYQKVKQVHDILINSLSYDTTLNRENTHNIYGGLVENVTVCDGYAKSLKYILDKLQIPCILVIGNATNTEGLNESHAWNYVQLDGIWYGIDTTWDDPLINGNNLEKTPKEYRYSYFLKGTETFKNSYTETRKFPNSETLILYPELSKSYGE